MFSENMQMSIVLDKYYPLFSPRVFFVFNYAQGSYNEIQQTYVIGLVNRSSEKL